MTRLSTIWLWGYSAFVARHSRRRCHIIKVISFVDLLDRPTAVSGGHRPRCRVVIDRGVGRLSTALCAVVAQLVYTRHVPIIVPVCGPRAGHQGRDRRHASVPRRPGRLRRLRCLARACVSRSSRRLSLTAVLLDASAWIVVPSRLILPRASTPASWVSSSTGEHTVLRSGRKVCRNTAPVSWSGRRLPTMSRNGIVSYVARARFCAN